MTHGRTHRTLDIGVVGTVIYYGERMHSEISEGKRHLGQRSQEARCGLPESSPSRGKQDTLDVPSKEL